MKTEVYCWRVSTDLKNSLEREARRRKVSLLAILDLAARAWLDEGYSAIEGDDEQLRRRKAAAQCLGAFAGGDAHRSENARQALRQRRR
jgi:hypothetical protein